MRAARSKPDIALAGPLVLAILPCLLASRLFAASPGAPVGLMDVRFGGDAATTRVVLDLDAPASAHLATVAAGPGRVALGLPTLLSTGAMQGSGHGLVIDWSVHDDTSGSTLVLDTSPGAVIVRRFLIPPGEGATGWRYVIDIGQGPASLSTASTGLRVSTPRQTALQSAPSPITGPTQAPAQAMLTSLPARDPSAPRLLSAAARFNPAAPSSNDDSITPPRAAAARSVAKAVATRGYKVVVIDAGHGGHDPGARSLVRNEKDITLAAALDLKARLETIGRYKVVLTRDHDEFIPLEERVQIARRAGADLFISLHADSAGGDPTPHGASIYTLSDSGQKRVNNVLGPHEWFSQAGARRNDPGVGQILLDLTQQSTRNRSSQFAGLLIRHISDRVDLLPRTHRDAGYFVLLAPDVPAVLLEMGFITNPGDEMRLTNPDQREHLMRGVADAIDAYFNGGTTLAAGL